MIGKAKSNQSLAATIEYNEKEKATLIYKNKLAGTTLPDFRMQMEDLQKCYKGRSSQLTIHAILSPAIEDGKNLSAKQWQTIAHKYLHQMNLQSHQAIGFVHADKQHRHLHLIINKVKESNFKLYQDSFIGKKSQHAADAIAKEMHLVRAKIVMQERINQMSRVEDVKQIGIKINEETSIGIKQKFKSELMSINKNKYSDTEGYFKALEKAGFKVHRYIKKGTTELRGYGIEKDGTIMNASAIGKEFTLQSLNIPIANNELSDKNIPETVKQKEVENEQQLIVDLKEKNIIAPEENKKNDTQKTDRQISSNLIKLRDPAKIKVLEKFALSMGVAKETLQNDKIEMLQKGKNYFIGFKNDSGGYSLQNVLMKTNVGAKNITAIITDTSKPTLVIEDMFDYLITKEIAKEECNYIILNSLSNQNLVIDKIKKLQLPKVLLLLKNDDAGNAVTKNIMSAVDVAGELVRDEIANLTMFNPDANKLKEGNNSNNEIYKAIQSEVPNAKNINHLFLLLKSKHNIEAKLILAEDTKQVKEIVFSNGITSVKGSKIDNSISYRNLIKAINNTGFKKGYIQLSPGRSSFRSIKNGIKEFLAENNQTIYNPGLEEDSDPLYMKSRGLR